MVLYPRRLEAGRAMQKRKADFRKKSAAVTAALRNREELKSMSALDDIATERMRQKDAEGYDRAHDDEHTDGSLAAAAACYALPKPTLGNKVEYEYPGRGECDVQQVYEGIPTLWPSSWHARFWKPKDRRRDLVRAGALIVAEIERLDRVAGFGRGLRRPKSSQTTRNHG